MLVYRRVNLLTKIPPHIKKFSNIPKWAAALAVAEAHIAPGSFAWSVAAGDADAAVWRPGIIGILGICQVTLW